MKKKKGFTLIELLVVIAIIGLLVAISVPAYQKHIRKGNRVAAILALTKFAQEFEREHARQGAYPASRTETSDHYTFTLTSSGDEFVLTAAPIGDSVNDECETLSVNQAGQTSASVSTCWD